MKNNPYLGEIIGPEYYHEVEGYDSRISIRKLMDVYQTLGDAAVALLYADKNEYKEDTFEIKIMRRTHLRHAIIDLNNCFDLLVQVPWFYYRIGLSKNTSIQRNSVDWVQKLEELCQNKIVISELQSSTDADKKSIGDAIKHFKKTYIFNSTKKFTVRTLANYLKHNGVLKLQEFDNPLNINFNLPGIGVVDNTKITTHLSVKFFDENNPSEELGEIKLINEGHALVDIAYNSGENFRGKDYSYTEDSLSFEEIYSEAVEYHDAFIDLLEVLHDNLYAKIPHSPFLKLSEVKVNKSEVNLDKWYK